ncbi:hypothetical protein BSL78_25929 [Apostichopus japonicus]|uniref:Uncharacterized protein n=1 Tax=Stichopus japonicus TaxID=307972 RepID=A0A2G8JNC3_STIJA|nr:hypothetical protein BSL78_25929 [Apostichopus japonicus]
MAQSRNAILSSNDACSLMSMRIGISFHCLEYLFANELRWCVMASRTGIIFNCLRPSAVYSPPISFIFPFSLLPLLFTLLDDVDDVEIFYDAELPDEPNPNDELLYEGAPLSKGQSTLLIMAYAFRNYLTQVVPLSSYRLRKECIFDLGKDDIVYDKHCRNCFAYLRTDKDLWPNNN